MTVDYIHQWLASNGEWLGVTIAFMAMIEAVAIVGLFVPGIPIMFALGALAGSGVMSAGAMLAWAFLGAVLGDGVSYQIGQSFHRKVIGWWPFSKHPALLDKGEEFFYHYGDFSIALGRFVGPVRPIVPVVAGMLDMPALRFYVVNILSAIPWAVVYMMPGYMAAQSIVTEEGNSLPLFGLLFAILLMGFLVFSLMLWWDKVAKSKLLVPGVGCLSGVFLLFFIGMIVSMGRAEQLHRMVMSWITNAHFSYLVEIGSRLDGFNYQIWVLTFVFICCLLSLWKNGKERTLIWGLVLIGMVGFQYLITLIVLNTDTVLSYIALSCIGNDLEWFGVFVYMAFYTCAYLSLNMLFLKRIVLINLIFMITVIVSGILLWRGSNLLVSILAELGFAGIWFCLGSMCGEMLVYQA